MKKTNKVLAIVSALVLTAMLGTGTVQAAENTGGYPNLPKISTSEIFKQQSDDYYVYFYMEECPYCNAVKPDVNKFVEAGGDIYGVDYADTSNRVNSYDWSQITGLYNTKIGHVDADGNKTYLPGESEEKYLNNTEENKYGKVMRYQITEVDENNIYSFPGAAAGDLYAEIQTPEIDYADVTDPADLVIAGVPTLLHIKDGKIDAFYFDTPEIASFLEGQMQIAR